MDEDLSNTALTLLVHVGQALQDLVGYIPNCGLREELGPMLDHVIQVLFHVLKDEEELVSLPTDLTQTHNVRMLQLLQGLERILIKLPVQNHA